MSTPNDSESKPQNVIRWKRIAMLAFGCFILWIAAASIQQSMLIAGQSRGLSTGARGARIKDEIESRMKSISALEKLDERTMAQNDRLAKELKEVAEKMYEDQQLSAALKKLLQAVSIEEKVYGFGDPRTLPTVLRMSEMEREMGHFLNAATLIERVINIEKEKLSKPDDAPEILMAMNNLGTIEISRAMTIEEPRAREQEMQRALNLLKDNQAKIQAQPDSKFGNPEKKSFLLMTNLQNQAFGLNQLGWLVEGSEKEAEAQTFRSALR